MDENKKMITFSDYARSTLYGRGVYSIGDVYSISCMAVVESGREEAADILSDLPNGKLGGLHQYGGGGKW